MEDKIDPTEIAENTGLTEDEVNGVLAELIPDWLFSTYVDNDLYDADYMRMAKE